MNPYSLMVTRRVHLHRLPRLEESSRPGGWALLYGIHKLGAPGNGRHRLLGYRNADAFAPAGHQDFACSLELGDHFWEIQSVTGERCHHGQKDGEEYQGQQVHCSG